MIRINWPPVDVANNGVASRFLLLDQRVVVCLARAAGCQLAPLRLLDTCRELIEGG